MEKTIFSLQKIDASQHYQNVKKHADKLLGVENALDLLKREYLFDLGIKENWI
jgi:hypothetical protein